MPIIIPKDLPAYKTLKTENIFVMSPKRAIVQDIRPIEIAIVNLMPAKELTETQIMRLLSNSPLQINITLITMETYKSKHVSENHMKRFYTSFSSIKDKKFDGMIITGAPLEKVDYDKISYWKELEDILEFTRTNVTSTIFICWGALAAFKYFYNIEKIDLREKLFGVYKYKACTKFEPLFKGLDDEFKIPMSRYADINIDDINDVKDLKLLAKNSKGPSIVKSKDGRRFFFLGHSEYDTYTLAKEYDRDIEIGLDIKEPDNYFDYKHRVLNTWSATSNLIFSNWINYYVYQITPYDIDKI